MKSTVPSLGLRVSGTDRTNRQDFASIPFKLRDREDLRDFPCISKTLDSIGHKVDAQ